MKQKKSKAKPKNQTKKFLFITLGCFLLFLILISSFFYLFFKDRILPSIYVGNISVGGLTKTEAQEKLTSALQGTLPEKVEFTYLNQSFTLDLGSNIEQSDIKTAVDQAFAIGHTSFPRLQTHISLSLGYNYDSQVMAIETVINQPAVNAQISVQDGTVVVTPSQNGTVLDEEMLKSEVLAYINSGVSPGKVLPTKVSYPTLSYSNALGIKKVLDSVTQTPINLVYTDDITKASVTYTLDLPTLLSLIDLNKSQSSIVSGNLLGQPINVQGFAFAGTTLSDTKLTLDPQKSADYFKTIATQINRDPKEPLFNFDQSANNGKGKVTQFQPPVDGKQLDITAATNLLSERLISGDLSEIPLPVITTPVKNKLTNQLGIKELLAEGTSHFYHSIPNRIYNLELAASRVNGTLVAPGDTFSFNETVGDISGASGYKPGYIISGGRTVLDDGGGVCQDSTTLFRAVLKAGLPVVARTAHAYRVGYYEQGFPPGLDATVFAPSVDFQFKNDTDASILIQAYADDNTQTLYYDLYGTSDGRVSTVSTPVILSTSPALPDVHQDDPTLPKGTIKQVDFAVSGANVVFYRTVTKNGQTLINETYRSNYQPWANIYLVGTGA